MIRFAPFLLLLVACDDSTFVPSTHTQHADAGVDVIECECPAAPVAIRYQREAYAGADPGQQATAVATCDPGDSAVLGGCTWGKAVGAMDAVSFGPAESGEAWQCTGLSTVDGGQTAVYAVATCEVSQ